MYSLYHPVLGDISVSVSHLPVCVFIVTQHRMVYNKKLGRAIRELIAHSVVNVPSTQTFPRFENQHFIALAKNHLNLSTENKSLGSKEINVQEHELERRIAHIAGADTFNSKFPKILSSLFTFDKECIIFGAGVFDDNYVLYAEHNFIIPIYVESEDTLTIQAAFSS